MNTSLLIIIAYSLAALVAITCLCIYIKWSKQKDKEWDIKWTRKKGSDNE